MTKFFEDAHHFIDEYALLAQKNVSWIENFCKDLGKPVEIELSILENVTSELSTFKIDNYSPKTATSGKTGGRYGVIISKGAIIRYCYLFEIFTYGWIRYKSKSNTEAQFVMIHDDQSVEGSKYLMNSNFFELDLGKSLFENFDASNNLIEATTRFESEFWPFEFSKLGFSAIAKHCATLALNFLLLHETAHIVRGHLEHIEEKYGLLVPLSQLLKSGKTEGAKEFQSMELDADFQAFETQLLNLVSANKDGKIDEIIELYIHTIGFLFAFSDLDVRTVSTHKNSTHPEADLRFMLAMSFLETTLKSIAPNFANAHTQDIKNYFHSAPRISMKILREVGVLGGGFSLYLSQLSDENVHSMLENLTKDLMENLVTQQENWEQRIAYSEYESEIEKYFENKK